MSGSDTSASPVGLHGSIDLRGALTSKAAYDVSFTSATDADCESYASRSSTPGEAVSFVLPLPTRVGDDHLAWTASIRPYRGPGRYALRAIPGLRLAVLGDDGNPTRTFASSPATRATAQVAADGSGIFTFANLGPASGRVSGTARWTCDDG